MNIYKLPFHIFKDILLENKTLKQTIFKNTFWVALGMGADKLLRLLLLVYVVRILGATEYGKFSFASAFVSLFVIFPDLGLRPIVVREFAGGAEKEEFGSIVSLKILLGIGTLALVVLGSFFITSDPNIQKIIFILAISSIMSSFTIIFYTFFQAFRRMEYWAWTDIVQGILMVIIGFLVIFNFPSVENLSYGYLVVSILVLLFALLIFYLKFFPLKIHWQSSIWRKFLAMSWPVALVGISATLYGYIDSVMMGYLGMLEETGWYNAALRISAVAILPAVFLSRSFLPVLSKFFKESGDKLQKAWNSQVEMVILIALPLMVGGVVLAPQIIGFFYPPDFAPSILAFQILIVAIGIASMCNPFYDVMIASNQQKRIFWVTFSGATVNIILNLILIPRYSLYGAAIAAMITYFSNFLIYIILIMKSTPIRPLQTRFLFTFILAAVSSSLMYMAVREPILYNLNVFLSIFLGGLVYCLAFLCLSIVFKKLKLYELKW